MPKNDFELERDEACRGTIIRTLIKKPVAYNGHPGHPGSPITELFIPDSTKKVLMEMWQKYGKPS